MTGIEHDADATDRRSVEERREQLIDAAIQVLASEGLGRATTRNITDHADLALGAFHYAFRSKDELLEAVMERGVSTTERVLRDDGEDVAGEPSRALAHMLDEFWNFVEQTPDLQLAQHELTVHALREPRMRRLAVDQQERYTAAVRDVIDRVPGAPRGEQAEDLARYLVATMEGLVVHRLIDDDPAGGRRRLRLHQRAIDSLLRNGSTHTALAS